MITRSPALCLASGRALRTGVFLELTRGPPRPTIDDVPKRTARCVCTILALLLGSVACVGPRDAEQPSAAPAGPTTRTVGLVQVVFSDWRSTDARSDRVVVTAAFARGVSQADTVARTFSGLEPSRPGGRTWGTEACEIVIPEPPRMAGASAVLLDVGPLAIEVHAGRFEIPQRAVPDLSAGVTGQRYEQTFERARMMLAPGRLAVEGRGGGEVGAFRAEVAIPRPVRLSFVGGVAMREGAAPVPPVRTLEVRWGSVDTPAPLELEIAPVGPEQVRVVRCRPRDDGVFHVPEEALSALPPRDTHAPWRVTLRRIATGALAASGLDEGELRLEMVDTVTIY